MSYERPLFPMSAAARGLGPVLLALTLTGCGGEATDHQPEGPKPTLAIQNVVLLDPVSGASEPSTLLLAGDRIVSAGASGDLEVPAGTGAVDGSGLFVIPGLWDLHTHLTHIEDFAPRLLVTQGVTGVRNLGSELEAIQALRERIDSGELLGPRIAWSGPTLNGAQNGPHHRVIATPEEAREAVTDLREISVDFLKTHNATGRDTYFALAEASTAAGLDLVGHVPTAVSPLEACEAGQASIEHIATVFEGTYLAGFESELEAFLGMADWEASVGPTLAECFARRQTLFVPTLRAYELRAHWAEEFDSPDPGLRYMSAEAMARREASPPTEMDRRPEVIELRQSLVDVGQRLVARLHAAGAPIGAGTDLSGSGLLPGFDLHREIELLAEAGLTPQEAIWASARGPGERAGGEPLTGRLVVGAPADLVLLRANAFEDVGALSQIEAVVLRGRLLDRAALDQVLGDLEREAAQAADP